MLALASAVCFALNAIFIRKGTATSRVLDAVLATIWINVLVFLPLSFLIYFPKFGLNLKSFLAFLGTGMIGTFMGRICYYTGIKRVGSSRAVAITRGNLLISSLIAIVFLKESITEEHLVGIFLLLGGIIIVSYEMEKNKSSSGWKPSLDLLIPLGAMIFMGIAVILGKVGLSGEASPVVGLAIKFSIALVGLSSYYLFKGDSPFKPFVAEDRKMYILAGLFLSIGFGLYYGGLKISRVVVVAPFKAMTPFFALILSYLYLKRLERITILLVLGSLAIIFGAVIIGFFM